MSTDPEVMEVFGTETNAFLAVQLGAILERLMERGIDFEKKILPSDRDVVHEMFEKKARPIIKEIMGRFRPEVIANIQGIDEGLVWKVFWDMRKDSIEPKISIFTLLAELNRNPPLAPVPA